MTDQAMMDVILNQKRLKVLQELALLDDSHETIYDKITVLASKVIGAPVSLLSLVASDYQFFKSEHGLPNPKQTPLSHSFCKHVVATNEPLIVEDAREHEVVKDNGAIKDLGVIGYLGMPVTLQDGRPLGSFCVIDTSPRQWTQVEVDLVREFAGIITSEIDLKALAYHDPHYQLQLTQAHQRILQLLASLDSGVSQESFLENLRQARAQFKV